DLETIRRAAESLDALEPPDGVWLQVAGRLRQEGRVQALPAPAASHAPRYACLAIAASLLLAVGIAIALLVTQYRTSGGPAQTIATAPPTATPNTAGETVAVESVEAEFRLAEQHYQNAIAKLEQAARLDQAASRGGEDALGPPTPRRAP